jgi:hypothetical protein
MRQLERKVNKRQEGRFLGKVDRNGRRWATKTKRAAKSREASRATCRQLAGNGLAQYLAQLPRSSMDPLYLRRSATAWTTSLILLDIYNPADNLRSFS